MYILASNAANFTSNVTLIVDNTVTETFVWDGNGYNDIEIHGQSYSLKLEANNKLYLEIANEKEDIPDQVLEMLARNTGEASSVYLDQTPATIHILNYENKEYRFLVSLFVDDTITDFQAMCLIRVDNNNTPLGQSIVVCRGSETNNWDFVSNLIDWDSDPNGLLEDTFLDWQDDSNRLGVGIEQYTSNKLRIMEWLRTRKDDTIYFTGHSLGGALAQRFASDYQGKIGGCVTFNSPGINDSKEIHATKVHHYVVNGDLISMIGNGYVYGDNASDSWYAMYMGNNRYDGPVLGSNDEENPTSYLLNRHTATLTSNENNGVDWGTISVLSDSEFSYIGAHDNFNANYARFVLSLAQRYERVELNNILCNSCLLHNVMRE
jgi:pimeloyl-ACP methyl ester carboxylesterase